MFGGSAVGDGGGTDGGGGAGGGGPIGGSGGVTCVDGAGGWVAGTFCDLCDCAQDKLASK